jgi:hypothetical protein
MAFDSSLRFNFRMISYRDYKLAIRACVCSGWEFSRCLQFNLKFFFFNFSFSSVVGLERGTS